MTFFDNFWDGKNMDYAESFVITYSKIIAIFSGVLIFFSFMLIVIVGLLHRNIRKSQNLLVQAESTSQSSFIPLEEFKNPKTTDLTCIILDICNIFLFWLAVCFLSLIFPASSAFELIPPAVSGFLLFVIYLFGMVNQVWRQSEHWGDKKISQRIMKSSYYFRYLLGAQTIIFLSASIILPLLFQKGCLCVFSSGYGIDTFLDLQFSTQWTRGHWLPSQVCPDGEVCHLYATLPQNAMNEVFLNVQTAKNIPKITLNLENVQIPCTQFNVPSKIEQRGQRNLFTCYAQNLQPDTIYPITIYNQNGDLLKTSTYLTPPQNVDLIMFFGGDFGYQTAGIDMIRTINQVNPHVILIGGDVAYDNGNPHCYYSWDLFLNIFEEQFTQMNRIIPFIFSLGNHDVGFNDYANYNKTVSEENGPLYFSYFPQRANKEGQVESIANRVPFNLHLIQNLAIYGLDSGYLYPHDGTQKEWLIETLKLHPNLNNVAHYHVPIYPSCFNNHTFMGDWNNIKKAEKIWIPIFDEYKFKASFENHVHQYKRTYPLKNSEKVDGGTVYFGDGSMGVKTKKCKEEEQTFAVGGPFENIFEQVIVEKSEHYWVLTSKVQENQIDFKAYTPQYSLIPGSGYVIDGKDDL